MMGDSCCCQFALFLVVTFALLYLTTNILVYRFRDFGHAYTHDDGMSC